MFGYNASNLAALNVARDAQIGGKLLVHGDRYEAFTVGVGGDTAFTAYSTMYGSLFMSDTPASVSSGDDVATIQQAIGLTRNNNAGVLRLLREGSLAGHDYLDPVLTINDLSAGSAPGFRVVKGGNTVLETPNIVQQIEGALSAVTDGNAKAVMASIIDLLLAYHMGANATT